MNYVLYNVTGRLINKPMIITNITARDYDDAFIKVKEQLCRGIREQLNLTNNILIKFTTPSQDTSITNNDSIRFTTCSIEDRDEYVIDTYEYAIAIDR